MYVICFFIHHNLQLKTKLRLIYFMLLLFNVNMSVIYPHGLLCRHFRNLRSIHDSKLCEKDGLNEDVFSIIGKHVIIIFWT